MSTGDIVGDWVCGEGVGTARAATIMIDHARVRRGLGLGFHEPRKTRLQGGGGGDKRSSASLRWYNILFDGHTQPARYMYQPGIIGSAMFATPEFAICVLWVC